MGEGKPSEAPRTFRTLRNSLLSLELAGPSVSPGLAFVPSSVPALTPDRFSIPRSFLPAGPQDISTVVSSSPLARALQVPRPRAARLSCFPPAERSPSAPSAGLRVGLAGIQAGKVPGSGAAARRRGCRRGSWCLQRVRATKASAASEDPGFPGCASFGQAAGRWWRGRSRPLRSGARPAGLGALPAWQAVLRIYPGGGFASAAPSLKTPSAWQEPRMWLPLCRARWRGWERRGQCLHLLTKGSRSSSPSERPAALRPPSRHLAALASRAASLCCCAACRWLQAAGGTERLGAVASGRLCAMGCAWVLSL